MDSTLKLEDCCVKMKILLLEKTK